jgi:hypothetical protein
MNPMILGAPDAYELRANITRSEYVSVIGEGIPIALRFAPQRAEFPTTAQLECLPSASNAHYLRHEDIVDCVDVAARATSRFPSSLETS